MSISARSGGLPWAASGREANESPHQAAGEVEVLGHGLVKFLLIDLEHSDRLGRYGRLCMSFAREQRQSAKQLAGAQLVGFVPVADERHAALQHQEHRVGGVIFTEEELSRFATDFPGDGGHAGDALGAHISKEWNPLQEIYFLDRG